jgi:hypothetical protein
MRRVAPVLAPRAHGPDHCWYTGPKARSEPPESIPMKLTESVIQQSDPEIKEH